MSRLFRDNPNKDYANECATKNDRRRLRNMRKQARVKITEPRSLLMILKEVFLTTQESEEMNPFRESWGELLKQSMCKGKDCEGCRACKCCPKCEPQGSTCEKMGCA